jgi:DNA polymerase III subunit gamma/tau
MTSSGSAASRRRCATRSPAKRIAQAFVFAGPGAVGKTTTARILARASTASTGRRPIPAASATPASRSRRGATSTSRDRRGHHTQVDKVREVIIEGLSIAPVRNRYKIFIIDEVHQLSQQARSTRC